MNDNERTQKTWTMELTEDEMIALAKVSCWFQDMLKEKGRATIEQLQTLDILDQIDEKMPEESWFSEEVRA